MVRSMWVAAAVLGVALVHTPVAAAPGAAQPQAAAFSALARCRGIAGDRERLACFDAAAAALDRAETEGQIVVIDRDQVKAVRRQSFGLTLPAFTLFNRGPAEDQVDRVTIELASADQDPRRRWIMTSTEGVVWAQTDDEDVSRDPHKGSTVSIRKAALGSYFCNIDGQRAVRCERRR